MIVVIGVDAHKKSHTLVSLDGNGRKLAEKTVQATDAGHAKALRWALVKFGSEDLTWGIEDCRHVSARLGRGLVDAGQRVVRVPTRLMARSRGSGRRPGESDPIDAEAVARVVLREPDLPVASHDEVSRDCKLLVDRREDLVGQRTATVNRLVWRLHELDPARSPGVLPELANPALDSVGNPALDEDALHVCVCQRDPNIYDAGPIPLCCISTILHQTQS